MICPSCKFDSAVHAAECERCGLVFAKYRSPNAPGRSPRRSSFFHRAAEALGAVAAVASAAYLYLWKTQPQALDRALARARARAPREAGRAAAAPVPAPARAEPDEKPWLFEGKVVDLARLVPVTGAAVKFFEPPGRRSFSALTDEHGHYSIELPPLPSGYEAQLCHPHYACDQYWRGDFDEVDPAERLRMGTVFEIRSREKGLFREGDPLESFDFALYPKSLSDDERRQAELGTAEQ